MQTMSTRIYYSGLYTESYNECFFSTRMFDCKLQKYFNSTDCQLFFILMIQVPCSFFLTIFGRLWMLWLLYTGHLTNIRTPTKLVERVSSWPPGPAYFYHINAIYRLPAVICEITYCLFYLCKCRLLQRSYYIRSNRMALMTKFLQHSLKHVFMNGRKEQSPC